MLLLRVPIAGNISWSSRLLQTFVDAIVAFCQDSPLTVGGEWLSSGRGVGTAARPPKVCSSCVADPIYLKSRQLLSATKQARACAKIAVLHQHGDKSRVHCAELLSC